MDAFAVAFFTVFHLELTFFSIGFQPKLESPVEEGGEIDFIILSVALVRKLTHLIWPKFDKTFRERLRDGLLLHYTLDLIYG